MEWPLVSLHSQSSWDWKAYSALVFLSLVITGTGTGARVDPSGRVRAILLGDVIVQSGSYNSFTVIGYDPAIQVTLIPSVPQFIGGFENAQRNLRVYMPRTYKLLVNGYQQLIFSDADPLVFKTEWIHWLSNSVTDGGLGMLWLGSITAESNLAGWGGTTIAEILPASERSGVYTIISAFFMKILDYDEELMQALPWEKAPALMNVNAQVPKEGCEYWAKLIPGEYPLMTYWEIGRGAVLNFASKFPAGVRVWASDWPLFPQSMIYMTYRVADKSLPDDPLVFISIINGFIEHNAANSLIESMLAWVENFGGNTRKLHERLELLDEKRQKAEAAYLGGYFPDAMIIIMELKAEQSELRSKAGEAKDEALLWVYVTEWFALTGTLLVSSYILLMLMVRRKLYRDVKVSRLRATSD